jgi:hypothetical protein
MKLAGFLLLPAGWIIVLAAVVLLPFSPSQAAFALAGMGVEIMGLTLVVRAHLIPHRDRG